MSSIQVGAGVGTHPHKGIGIFNFVINGVDWQEALAVGRQSNGSLIVVGTMNHNTGVQWNPDVTQWAANAHFNPYALRLTPNGLLDTSFGAGGYFSIDDFPGVFHLDSEGTDLKILADDSILISFQRILTPAGSITDSEINVAKLTKDGLLDATFGTNGVVRNIEPNGIYIDIAKVAVQSTGKIILAGTISVPGLNTVVYSLNANGSPNTPWGNAGTNFFQPGRNDSAYQQAQCRTVFVQADDKVVVGMLYNENDPTNQNWGVCRINADGTADAGWGTIDSTALIAPPSINGVASPYAGFLQEPVTGKIIVAGWMNYSSFNYGAISLCRLNATTGALDTTFGTSGITNTHLGVNVWDQTFSQAMFYDINGKIVIGGTSGTTDPGRGYHIPNFQFMICRYTANGAVDTSFNGTGVKTIDITGNGAADNQTVYGGLSQPDGKYVFCGHYGSAINHNAGHVPGSKLWVARFDTSGNFDTSFGLPGFTSNPGPAVTTNAASSITATTAVANATITPSTGTNSWVFQFGTASGLYTRQSATQTAVSGANSVLLSGLTTATTYYGKAIAWSANGGITLGDEVSFTTS